MVVYRRRYTNMREIAHPKYETFMLINIRDSLVSNKISVQQSSNASHQNYKKLARFYTRLICLILCGFNARVSSIDYQSSSVN